MSAELRCRALGYFLSRRLPTWWAPLLVVRVAGWLMVGAATLAFSTLACAQSSKPKECNLESTGFCITKSVGTLPLADPTPQPGEHLNAPPSAQKRLHVELQNGFLRIDAENVTFVETLKAVSVRTGAEVQFPAGALREPIFVHLGPGKPRDIINQLLKGSPFNYLVLSSDSRPDEITRVILTKATSGTESAVSETPVIPASDPAALTAYTDDPDAVPVGTAPIQQPATANSVPLRLSGETLARALKLQQQRQQQSQNTPPP